MRQQPTPPDKLAVFSWILYDFANTIYSMNVVSIYFSLWITVNLAKEDLWVSVGNSTSMLLVAVTMPILGTLSDFLRRRLFFLFILTIISVLGTAAIGLSGYLFEELFIAVAAVISYTVANYAYQGSLVFYNALLPQLTSPEKMGKISGWGVSAGYLGAIFGLLIVMPFAEGRISFFGLEFKQLNKEYESIARISPDQNRFLDDSIQSNPNYSYKIQLINQNNNQIEHQIKVSYSDTVIVLDNGTRQRAVILKWPDTENYDKINHIRILRRESGWGRLGTFIPTAILFLLFALPCFVFIKEDATLKTAGMKVDLSLKHALKTVWEGISNTRKFPGVLRFLLAKFFYEEGIETAIIFMGVYAVKVMGFPNNILISFFIITTTAAVIGSFIFGYVTDWLGSKKTLLMVIGGWIGCLAFLIYTNNQSHFWIIGSLVGIFMGSTWTSARPLLLTLVPPQMAGEFFGLYAFSGKAASVVGPLTWGIVVYLLRDFGDLIRYKAAVGVLTVFMVIGFILLIKVPDKKATTPSA
ncbi:MFS transporter [candidate division KSB1 bacterium]|nr:MFS transporter [candidate division KSB1 bacterium]